MHLFLPSIGRKFYIGSDILLNRREKKVKIEIDYSFQLNGEDIEEPTDLYALQLLPIGLKTAGVWSDPKTSASASARSINFHPKKPK